MKTRTLTRASPNQAPTAIATFAPVVRNDLGGRGVGGGSSEAGVVGAVGGVVDGIMLTVDGETPIVEIIV